MFESRQARQLNPLYRRGFCFLRFIPRICEISLRGSDNEELGSHWKNGRPRCSDVQKPLLNGESCGLLPAKELIRYLYQNDNLGEEER